MNYIEYDTEMGALFSRLILCQDVIIMHADKLAYFFIAFAVVLILKAIAVCMSSPFVNVLLYISVAISLLASNIPRVMDIPIHYVLPIRKVEYFTFFIAVICFIVLGVRHIV